MHRLGAALLIVVLASSGCARPAAQDAPPEDGPTNDLPGPALPEGFEDAGAVVASVYSVTAECSGEHQCSVYEFDVDDAWAGVANVTMHAVLTWLVPSSVFELILYLGNAEIAADYDTSPDRTGRLDVDLAPGHYRLVVSAYAVAYDEFDLQAGFERATA